jgi:hypothetical protein
MLLCSQKYKNSEIEPASPYCIDGGAGNCVLMYSNNIRTIGKNLSNTDQYFTTPIYVTQSADENGLPKADKQGSLLTAAALVAAAVVVPVVHVVRGEILLQEGVLLLAPFRRLGRRFFRLFFVVWSRGATLTGQAQLASSARKKNVRF